VLVLFIALRSGSVSSAAPSAGSVGSARVATSSPIKHVVIIYQENHSFDNVLGVLCQDVVNGQKRCDGATTGVLPKGTTIPLSRTPDLVPYVYHDSNSQLAAMAGGAMNGFANIKGCQAADPVPYQCYSQYQPGDIPNLSALARKFTINDRTFEMNPVPSFGAHLELVSQDLDGFVGDIPIPNNYGVSVNPGWGCNSNKDATWHAAPGGPVIFVPSCVPDYDLGLRNGGAYRPTPVKHVPTVMDEMDAAPTPVTWRLYTGFGPQTPSSSSWAICPYFADCWYTKQSRNEANPAQFITDAKAGTLPAFSVVLPSGPEGSTSQHNGYSMLEGDDWIGQMLSALIGGPDWSSTAAFITYDDCGCFYDHVPPPNGWGIRVPMVIVSPYAKPAFTDSTPADFSSLLAFTEHVFGLPALSSRDGNVYDFANAFNFTSPAHSNRPRMAREYVSPEEQRQLDAIVPDGDST
jgi:phospholipase C